MRKPSRIVPAPCPNADVPGSFCVIGGEKALNDSEGPNSLVNASHNGC